MPKKLLDEQGHLEAHGGTAYFAVHEDGTIMAMFREREQCRKYVDTMKKYHREKGHTQKGTINLWYRRNGQIHD